MESDVDEYFPLNSDDEDDNEEFVLAPETPLSRQDETVMKVDSTIEVEGVEGISQEVIALYFENKKRSDGGDIDSITLSGHKESCTAIIVFKEAHVAARILNRTVPFILNRQTLHVKKPDDVDPFSIEIRNIEPHITKDSLELFVEKWSGGCETKELKCHRDSKSAIVTFTDRKVARRLLTNYGGSPQEHDDCLLSLFPHKLTKLQQENVDPRIVVVEGINPKTSKKCLVMYLQSEKKCGGGDVADVHYDPKGGTATVVFKSEKVAARVLNQTSLHLDEYALITRRPTSNTNVVHSAGEFPTKSSGARSNRSNFDTIIIEDLKATTKAYDIRRFLENRKLSGGGDITKIEMFPERNIAVIQFRSKSDAEDIGKRKRLTFRGFNCNVYPVDSSLQNNSRYKGPLAILVEGINHDTRKERIELLFNTRKKSGGESITNIHWVPRDGKAVITFKHARTVNNVCNMHDDQPLTLNQCEMKITKLTGIPPKLVPEPTEPKKALIVNAPCLTPEELKQYLYDAEVFFPDLAHVLYSYTGETILLEFNEDPDFEDLGLLFGTTPLDDHMLTLQRVAQTTMIQVHHTEIFDDDEELVEMYFQQPESGGSESVTIHEHLNKDQHYIILECHTPTDVPKITQKKLTFADQRVKVLPFYPDFGLIPPCFDATKPKKLMPHPFTHLLDSDTHRAQHKYEFFCTFEDARNTLTDIDDTNKLFEINWAKSSECGLVVEPMQSYTETEKEIPWAELCRRELDQVLDNIRVVEIPALTEVLIEIQEFVSKETVHKSILVKIQEQLGILILTGFADDVDRIDESARKMSEEMQEKLERAKKAVSEKIQLETHHVSLIRAHKSLEELAEGHPKMNIEISDSNVLLLQGLAQEVQKVQMSILMNIVGRTLYQNLQLTATKCTLLKRKSVSEDVSSIFRQEKVITVLDIGQQDVTLYALSNESLNKASSIIKNVLQEQTFPLSKDSIPLIHTTTWQIFQNKLHQRFSDMILTVDVENKAGIQVCCQKNVLDIVLEEINVFVEKNSIHEEFVQLPPAIVKLLDEHSKPQLDGIRTRFANSCATLVAIREQQRHGYIIKGNRCALPNIVRAVENLTSKVKVFEYPVHPAMSEYFLRGAGKQIIDSHTYQYKFTWEFGWLFDESRNFTGAKAGHREVFRVKLRNGAVVKIIHGDITALKMDAIVNPANEDLKHRGGLAAEIVKKGGYAIQKECTEHVEVAGKVLTGRVFLGRESGQLPCKFVIHAVGPKGAGQNRENELYNVILNSLDVSERERLSNIAFPAISTGVFGYPVKEATRTICEAVVDFFETDGYSLREVCLVGADQATVNAFKQAIDGVMIEMGSRSDPVHNTQHIEPESEVPADIVPTKPLKSLTVWHKGSQSHELVTTNGLAVQVKIASIVDEKVDVSVNTTNVQLDLSQGAVSQALLKAAGPIIQQECNEFAPHGIKFGSIVETSSGKMKNVKALYHGTCSEWDGPKGISRKNLYQLISSCLQQAHADRHTSIALPAIGTGNLHIPPNVVSEVMFEAFLSFSEQYPSSPLNDVRVVLYKGDAQTIEAFKQYLGILVAGASDRNIQPKRALHALASGISTAKSTASSRSTGAKSVKKDFGNVSVIVKQGDITQERTCAIVNPTNNVLDFTKGAVSKAILDAGGRRIAAECEQFVTLKGRLEGTFVTNAGNLNCQKIVHLIHHKHDQSLEERVRQALQVADKYEMKSISFPAVSTGAFSQNKPTSSSSAMLSAILRYITDDCPLHMRQIYIIIDDSTTYKAFEKELHHLEHGNSSNNFMTRIRKAICSTQSNKSAPSTVEKIKKKPQENVSIKLWSMEQDNIDSVVMKLKKLTGDELMIEKMDDPDTQETIKILTQEQKFEINSLADKYGVKLEIECWARLYRIVVQGTQRSVSSCVMEIRTLFREVRESRDLSLKIKEVSTLVRWEVKRTVRYEPYEIDKNFYIEKAYTGHKADFTWEKLGASFCVHFDDMKEVHEDQNHGRTISPVRRKFILREDMNSSLPDEWKDMSNEEYYCQVPLDQADPQYIDVRTNFLSTHDKGRILKIERVQNPSLYQQYVMKRNQIDRLNPHGHTNERTLYHGTPCDTVPHIINSGFNRSYCGKNAVLFGNGVYFARDASYSARTLYSPPDVRGRKYIFQCKVLTGEFTTGQKGMITPPTKDLRNPHILFDSVVDKMIQDPQIFVIFNDIQAYPEYLITFE